MHPYPSVRRVERVRHELRRRDVTVSRIEQPSPGFVAITFTGDALADFASLSFDDHVKFIVQDAAGAPHRRDFTPRSFNLQAHELTLEFALHGHGVASAWARQARVGDNAVIGGPRGSMIIPADYDWQLLAGDASALPAMRRRLEELPRGARVRVLAQVAAEADRTAFTTQATAEVRWVADEQALIQSLREMPTPEGEGFVWCAGEAAVMARVREVVLTEKQVPRESTRISAYWKRGTADFHEDL